MLAGVITELHCQRLLSLPVQTALGSQAAPAVLRNALLVPPEQIED